MTSASTTASKRRPSTALRSVKNSPRRPRCLNMRPASSMAVSSRSMPTTLAPSRARRASSAPSPQPISRIERLAVHWRATQAMRERVYGQPWIGCNEASRQWYACRSRYFAKPPAMAADDATGSEPRAPTFPHDALGLGKIFERVDVHQSTRGRERPRLGAEHRVMRAEHGGAEDVHGAVLHEGPPELLAAHGHRHVTENAVRIAVLVNLELLEPVEASRHLRDGEDRVGIAERSDGRLDHLGRAQG